MSMMAAERGCGSPKKGGMYFAIETSPFGQDPFNFLMDPIRPIPEDMALKQRGLTLTEVQGIYHIVDWVGANYYPNFADWFEEFARLGFHQRVEKNLNFKLLDPAKSMFFMVHPRAFLPTPLYRKMVMHAHPVLEGANFNTCDLGHDEMWSSGEDLEDFSECCAYTGWHHLEQGESIGPDGRVIRKMPSFSYKGWEMSQRIQKVPGFFAGFPISMMKALIYTGDAGEHEKTAEEAKEHGLWKEPEFMSLESK